MTLVIAIFGGGSVSLGKQNKRKQMGLHQTKKLSLCKGNHQQTKGSLLKGRKYLQMTSSKGLRWRRQWHPTPVLLPGKSHGRRSLVGCSPWGRYKSDTTVRLHFHFSLSCTGEGNSNPLQCSCLENLRDEGAWWAAIYGVAQSQTQLKRLSSSSSSSMRHAGS